MRNYFIFDGKDSRDFGVYISGQGTFKAPARSYDAIQIPGRNGALLGIGSRLENVELTYPAFIYSNFKTNLAALRAYLLSHAGYFKLSDSYHPDEYRMAYFTGPLEPDVTSANNAGEFNITFVCKPQRFLNSGDTVTSFTPGGANQRTYTGEMATFDAEAGDAITSLLAQFSPQQDLHGYTKPWAAGAGKNILPYPNSKPASSAGINFTYNDDGSITFSGTASALVNLYFPAYTYLDIPNGNYVLSGGINNRIYITCYDGTDATGTRYDDTGNGVTVTITSGHIYNVRLVILSGTAISPSSPVTIYPMLRLASSAAGYEPYANICPITGRTGANAYRTGKNLCRVAFAFGTSQGVTYTENDDGTVHCNGTALAESFSAGSITGPASNRDSRCMYTVPAGTYTISNISGVRLWVQFRNADNTANTATATNIAVGASKTVTFTEPTIIYIRSDIATGTVVDTDMQVMVTKGSTAATVYEPWQKQTVTVDWTSVAGTQYRGSFDPVTGKLTATSILLELDGVTTGKKMNNSGSYPGFNSYYSFYDDGKTYGSDIWVSKADAESDNACSSVMPYFDETAQISYAFRNNAQGEFQIRIQFPTSAGISTLAAANQWLNDLYTAGTPCTICYPLETPVEYQLTPISIPLLEGENNIWTDAGDVTVVVTDGQKIVNPTMFDALPLLRVYGVGTLGLGENLIVITNADSYTDIDCDMMDCFKESVNKNQYVQFSGNDFPTLKPGDNLVTFSGITQVDIKPRWWSV